MTYSRTVTRSTIILGLALLGCEHKVLRVDYLIPPPCISKAELFGCHGIGSPPLCQHARVTYKKGCEQIVAK